MSGSKNMLSIYKGDYEYILGQKIGSGGNGKVYQATAKNKSGISNNSNCRKYALKVFFPNQNLSCERREIRKDRFFREISANKHLKTIDGVIPIIDSCLPNIKDDPWFVMPLAKEFTFSGKFTLKTLELMLDLAKTISKMHEKGYHHRDIKPSNILWYKNRLFLSDFGLLWSEEANEHITLSDEDIGPYNIRPPELEGLHLQSRNEYSKSDVYLFAKTLWIVLTNNKKGFPGRYTRVNKNQYLKYFVKTQYTLEPLHRLMEQSTFDEYDKRITMDECIDLLQTQIAIIKGECAKDVIQELQYKESYEEIINSISPECFVYKDKTKICKILKNMTNKSMVIAEGSIDNIDLGLFTNTYSSGGNSYVLETVANHKNTKYYMCINDIEVQSNNEIIIHVIKYSGNINNYSVCKDADDLVVSYDNDIILDDELILKLVYKTM